MKVFNRKSHWESIYQTKELKDVSWHEPIPQTSIDFFTQYKVSKTAKVIDIGGGDSLLVDHLVDMGYRDITVLDISETAINRAKKRLGQRANKVNWIVSDISSFHPTEQYDFWHDRAAYHFLTREDEISSYIETASRHINPAGILVLGTFSEKGPKKCSGLEIKQYSESELTNRFKHEFKKRICIEIDHKTPSGVFQNFVFCSFKKGS